VAGLASRYDAVVGVRAPASIALVLLGSVAAGPRDVAIGSAAPGHREPAPATGC
jgi:hypothetical protein